MASPLVTAALVLALGAALSVPVRAGEKVSFNREIRPIFSDTCFQCHGPDEAKRKSGLRLDMRESALQPAKSGETAIVPGHPEESELVKRLMATDPEDVMPPERLHKPITPAQLATVKRWIAEGAEYQPHWAFIPPERPEVPAVPGPVRNPIDAFIQARLAAEGLAPSPEASRETLIRRVSLDLIGLPPTPEETAAFLADSSPEAYEKVVDRLLASPRYGERMAVSWLDSARYADSNGFQSDSSRQMWAWRDWVIEAFNRNEPFDQFTIDQLAGDLVPDPTPAQLIATGFHRNARLNGEGGRIVEEWFAETVIDRVETTGATWLGLTVGCCRCHDHKFDPITQREFYQLFAFFNSVDESGVLDANNREGGNSKPLLRLPTPAQAAEQTELRAAVTAREQAVQAAQAALPQEEQAWEAGLAAQLGAEEKTWHALPPSDVRSEGGATFTPQPDGTWLVGGPRVAHDTYTVSMPIPAGQFTGLRLVALPDPSMPKGSLGRTGNFVLTGVEAELSGASLPQQKVIEFARAEASYEQKGFEARLIVEENGPHGTNPAVRKGWAVDGGQAGKALPRSAMFLTAQPVAVPAEATLIVRLRHESAFPEHNIGRFRLEVTSLPPDSVKLEGNVVPEAIRDTLARAAEERTPAQKEALLKYFREHSENPVSRAEAALAAARKRLTTAEAEVRDTMIMRELPKPRPAFILVRGEYDKPGAEVQRGLPAALPPLPAGAPMNRLGLAQWLVSPANPLTARVWVNRTWAKFFGLGLVRTTENLGSQAEWPSHPELLDWLATEFVRLGWDMKAMQKTIVMSGTYRQSSRVTPELEQRDAENRLLARGPRFRLGAEQLRDQALAVSGLLVQKIGGPSVHPYMPARVWDETSVYGDLRGYKADQGDGLYRRSLYTVWKRTAAPPSMTMFDSPTREICTVKRSSTNTPLQALSLLNEVTYVEAARVLAEKMIAEGGSTPEERIAWGFRRTTARPPTPAELTLLSAGLAKRLERFAGEKAEAAKLNTVGAAPVSKAEPAELAAYAVTANVLLNLDEVVTRE